MHETPAPLYRKRPPGASANRTVLELVTWRVLDLVSPPGATYLAHKLPGPETGPSHLAGLKNNAPSG
jgi:hypothetical protein